MATTAQITANRKNARKSTGPKTAGGKAAVSQNAVKHGLFAAEAVILGEDPAVYEDFHDKFLEDLAPVGMAETVLAERVVSLSWRLRRAVRMQNQAIDVLMAKTETDEWQKTQRDRTTEAQDPRACRLELMLGWATTNDFTHSCIIERLMLYERRIENNMLKMMRELKSFQVIRQVQHGPRGREASPIVTKACDIKNAECYRPEVETDDLKKQSQSPAFGGKFMPEVSEARSSKSETEAFEKTKPISDDGKSLSALGKKDYGDMPAFETEENKANQSQSRPSPEKREQADTGKLAFLK